MAECYGNACDGPGLPCIWCDAPAPSMSDLATPEDGPDVHDELCPVTTRGGGRMYPTADDGSGCWVCDGLRSARAYQHHATRQRIMTALLNARDRRPFAPWSLAKVIALVDGASR